MTSASKHLFSNKAWNMFSALRTIYRRNTKLVPWQCMTKNIRSFRTGDIRGNSIRISGTAAVPLAFYSVEAEGCVNEKPPIIFIHGITTSKEFWNDIPRLVANVTKRKVFAVDLRNHGDSEWSDSESFDCNVDDLFHFMDSIQVQKAILVGHSLGGATAMRIALSAKDRVESLVVEDMPVKNVPSFVHQMVLLHMKLNQAAVQHLPPGLDEGAAKQFLVDFVYDRIPPEIKKVISKPVPEHYNGKLKPTEDGRYTFKANVSTLQKALENASKGIHPEITGVYEGPACFIYGKNSPFKVLTDEENIKKFFPNAQLIGIENATHLVHTDYPQEFTEALLKFISKE